MVLNLSWSCSRGYHKHGVHAEVSGTGAESRRGRENHPLGDDAPRAQPATGQPQALLSSTKAWFRSVFSTAARLTVLLNMGLSSPTGETTIPPVLPDGRRG
jgi:hypothetical protein